MTVKLIAEVGWNHMGDMGLAKTMIQEAAAAGADTVKFQTWSEKSLKPGPWDEDGRRQIYQQAALTMENHILLRDHCNQNGVKFLTSCFSTDSVEMVESLCDEVKVPSTELSNTALIDEIVRVFGTNPRHHVYLSTGSCVWDEVIQARDTLVEADMNFTLLHCVSSYPCLPERCNLMRIKDLSDLHERVGYSGHFPGIFDALASLEMGVEVIEKHFTVNHNLPGRDNKFAILPGELSQISKYIKAREQMLYYSGRNYLKCESDSRENYRGRWVNDTT